VKRRENRKAIYKTAPVGSRKRGTRPSGIGSPHGHQAKGIFAEFESIFFFALGMLGPTIWLSLKARNNRKPRGEHRWRERLYTKDIKGD
jgi:hypothetical protein